MDNRQLVPVEYIGKKRRKTDTVTGSGFIWNGQGDVQLVPIAIAQRLLEPRYAEIWRLGPVQALAAAPQAPPSAPPVGKRSQGDELALVVNAIGELLSGDDAATHLDEQGMPKVEALSKVLGREVTVAERDAAWALVT